MSNFEFRYRLVTYSVQSSPEALEIILVKAPTVATAEQKRIHRHVLEVLNEILGFNLS